MCVSFFNWDVGDRMMVTLIIWIRIIFQYWGYARCFDCQQSREMNDLGQKQRGPKTGDKLEPKQQEGYRVGKQRLGAMRVARRQNKI